MFCHKTNPMIPVHRLASRPDALGQTLNRPSRSDLNRCCTINDPCLLWKNGTESDAGSRMRHNYTIRPDSGRTLAVMAIIGRNQEASGSDPACLLVDPATLP